jgi:gluconolactonase
MTSVKPAAAKRETGLTRLVSGYGLLEGARWYPRHGLVFSDMTRGGVYRMPGTGAAGDSADAGGDDAGADGVAVETVIPHRKAIGGLVAHADGGFVVSGRNVSRKTVSCSTGEGVTAVLLKAAPDEQFFNDITADGQGRLLAGSMPKAAGAAGRLYLVGLDGSASVLADDVLISNGLAADPGDTLLYHVDSGRKTVWRFPLGASDPGAGREEFASTAEYDALPDGLALAADGSVWVALAGAGLVVGWSAVRARIAEISVPHALVTSVCFGGPDLDSLYILTGTNEEYPNPEGGSVFRCPAPRHGLPAPHARVRPARAS